MKSGADRKLGGRCKYGAAAFCIFSLSVFGVISPLKGYDTSEALRLWKFVYHMEAAAYGLQYMSKELLEKASKQLETASGQTMVTSTAMRVCVDAADELSDYFEFAAKYKDVPAPAEEKKQIRSRYEAARAGCIELLGSDPAEYPLGWPD